MGGNLGYAFEAELTKTLQRYFGNLANKCYRIIGSGQSKNATVTGGDILRGDVFLELKQLSLKLRFLIEAKWYRTKGKNAKSMAIRKDWLDQCRHEAELENCLAVLAFKMKGENKRSKELKQYSFYGRDANAIWVALPLKHFALLVWLAFKAVRTAKRRK